MATLASLTLDVLDMIYGQTPMSRPDVDTLATEVTNAADVTWRFTQAGTQFWKRGDFAELFDGTGTAGEVIQLMAEHDTAAADVAVLRGQRRTTATVAAIAVGAAFLRNPPFTHTEIQKEINATINSDLQVGLWYRSHRQFSHQTGRNRYQLPVRDYRIDRVYQVDTDADTLGAASFDFEGGTSDDLWTLTSHGLAVGDPVRFSVVATGAPEYAAGVVYWVATVPSANTFQLSATESTVVLEGTADSVGTWTLTKINSFNFREFPRSAYQEIGEIDTSIESTGRSLLLRSLVDEDATVYAVTRTRPASSAISELPAEIANLVPWGAVARLMGGTATRARHGESAASSPTIAYVDAGFFRSEFKRQVDEYKTRLLSDLQPQRRFMDGPIWG